MPPGCDAARAYDIMGLAQPYLICSLKSFTRLSNHPQSKAVLLSNRPSAISDSPGATMGTLGNDMPITAGLQHENFGTGQHNRETL